MNYSSVLVTGGAGFIGRHLMELLPGATCLDIKNGEEQDICCDLPDQDFKYVFHLAACKSIPKGEKNPEEFIKVNCWGSTNIIRAYPKARIVNVSSSSANHIKSVYGATKLFSEQIGKLHPNCINVRLYNVFGEYQEPESGAVVPRFLQGIEDGKVEIYGDGKQSRDFTYVGDVVRCLMSLMFQHKEVGVMHVGYSDSISVNDLLELILKLQNRPQVVIDKKAAREFDIEYSKSPNEIPIEFGRIEGLKRTIKWFDDEYLKSRV